MDAHPEKLINYFSQKKQFLIPLFQRPYVWGKADWEKLWKDILSYYGTDEEILNSSPHFMGAIVSIPARSVPVGIDKHLIIDGQQRLTTISILLCVLRDTIEDEGLKEEIRDLLINKSRKNTADFLKLMPTQTDQAIYSKIVNFETQNCEKEKTESGILGCYLYFKKNILKNLDEENQPILPQKIYDIIQSLFQVVAINLSGTDDPYLIFESLNFNGVRLTQTDLIRNLILMKFQHSFGEEGKQKEVYDKFWCPLQERLNNKIEDFFFHYIRMKNAVKSKKTQVYSDMKQLLQNEGVESCLMDIHKNSEYYTSLLFPENEKNVSIREELRFLNRTENFIVYPLLLKMCNFREKGLTDEVYYRCLVILNSFIMRRAICKWQTAVVNTELVKLLSTFPSDVTNLDEWLAGELAFRTKAARWPDDEDFSSAILTNVETSKSIQRLFLESIENFLAKKEVVDLSNMTLEHIMPQTLSTQWIEELGENYEQIHSKYLWNIGNLTLTGYNSEYSNRTFNEKKTMENGFAASGLKMNLEIAKFEKWGEAEILQRANALAEIAVQIWKYPVNTPKTKLNLNNVWTSKVVQCLVINGRRVPVASWRESAKTILNYFQKENPETFSKRLSAGELPKVQYVPLEQNDGCAFEVKLDCSAEDIRKAILKWCSLMKCDTSLFIFEVINA